MTAAERVTADARELIQRTRINRGLPATVTDPAVIERVAAAIRAASTTEVRPQPRRRAQ